MKAATYLSSPSVLLGLGVGALMYVSYGLAHHALNNLALIAMCLFIGCFIPYYSKLSNKLEEQANLRTARVSLGRLARFLPQVAFNLAVFVVLTVAEVFPHDNIESMGGVVGMALLTTCASQGMQYLALAFANREIGDRNRNVLLALSINIAVTAVATIGLPWAKAAFMVLGFAFGGLFFVLGLLSDWRAFRPKKGGVGVFFGTFNPIHRTHLALIRDAIESRGLSKVYLHSTTIPKLHADALQRGEIVIAQYDRGMRVYKKTASADVHVNYFPTGSKFYEYETRLAMMRSAIEEAGLSPMVEVLSLPNEYASGGFYAVLAEIKALAQGQPIHGIHGSDLGGMWVRGIYDEAGWIYPYPVVRRDKVSATAIRNGATGLTTQTVQQMIEALGDGNSALAARPQ
jgi:nicotinic acid mononucleotide adenylyltransferase